MSKKKLKKAVAEPVLEERDWSISDPAFAAWLLGPTSAAGVTITNESSLGVPALWRAVNLISTTIASLPLKTYREDSDGNRVHIKSWVDSPNPWMSPFSFKQLVVTHLVVDGNAFLLHIYNGAGAIIGLQPIHPGCVTVEWDEDLGAKIFKVTVDGQQRIYSGLDVTHVHGMTLDGLRGLSPIYTCRNAIGTAIAGNESAARQFANGGILSGIVTSEEDLDEEEAKAIKQDLDNRMTGVKNAGAIAFVNRTLKFDKWMMTADEAQFVEQRSFSVEEIARLTGVPKVLLASDGASTWGSGISELNRGLARYTFPAYTKPLEEALSALLANPRFCEFDMKGLIQSSPEEEIRLLIEQVESGLLSLNEARAILNLPALDEPQPVQEESEV